VQSHIGASGLVSRNLKQFNFVILSNSLAELPVKNAILNGEVVCLDNNGVSQFNYLISRKHEPLFYAFDLLWLNGKDLRRLPRLDRKRKLEQLVKKAKCREILYAHHIVRNGVGFFEEICARDLEGIIAKRKRGGWVVLKIIASAILLLTAAFFSVCRYERPVTKTRPSDCVHAPQSHRHRSRQF
jgi:ATP-dependent DNA ligase